MPVQSGVSSLRGKDGRKRRTAELVSARKPNRLERNVSADAAFVVLELWDDREERGGEGCQEDMRKTGESGQDEDACRGRGDEI